MLRRLSISSALAQIRKLNSHVRLDKKVETLDIAVHEPPAVQMLYPRRTAQHEFHTYWPVKSRRRIGIQLQELVKRASVAIFRNQTDGRG
jgi:hypothetical protein